MIDMTKKYKTRDGRDVRILCVDGPGPFPVAGFVGDIVGQWTAEGRYIGTGFGLECDKDLIEHVPEVVTWCCLVNLDDRIGILGGMREQETDQRGLVGHLRITQPAGNTDITKVKVEAVPLGETK